ncbi:MAG: signal peptide peptidase SppA [Bacteroidales bacterium]|nr:signal peptide peptidase SppA [Bacteroidales bacterium]
MKPSFWKTVLAVIVGTLIASILCSLLCLMFLSGLGAAAPSGNVNKPGLLKLDLGTVQITEQKTESFTITGSSAESVRTIGLLDAVNAIAIAAEDPNVKHIYLKTDGNLNSIACCEELRAALARFRESGKGIIAYIESPSTSGYYVASVADKIYMGNYHGANIMLTGVGGQMIFLSDLLDRFGVKMQLIRHGKYKSAGEMFVRNSASAENREQNERMVTSIWETLSADIAASRGISVERLNTAIDNLELCMPEDFVQAGLVDELVGRAELQQKMADLAVADDIQDVNFIAFESYVEAKCLPNLRARKQIAVVYAQGEIVDGSAIDAVASDDFVKMIETVRADSAVKAVVLRVDSPGGSVSASEKIEEQIRLLRAVKPVIASYGDYAASGGYWISNGCDHIFSDATTLTGSIGVFGMVPDFSKTAKEVLHIGVESVGSNKHTDMYSLMRPFDKDEYRYVERSIEDIYERFTKLVSEGRDMSVERVDELGQGRVWTGADALEAGLVDEIGTLTDALQYAACAAGDGEMGNWLVTAYPAPLTMMENVLASLGQQKETEEGVLIRRLRENAKPQVLARMPFEFRF